MNESVASSVPGLSDPRRSAGAAGGVDAGAKGGAPATTITSSARDEGNPTTTTTSTTVPPGLAAEKCPEPKTCRRYGFMAGMASRWRIGPDGRATIRYRINPSGVTSSITPEQIEGAVAAAMATWEHAAPTLRFVYEGRTDRLAVQGDSVSVISFNAPETARTFIGENRAGYLEEFDIYFRPGGWVWAPCEQRDGSCTPYSSPGRVAGTSEVDLQAVATHEIGHAIWLRDMTDNDLDRELTMYPGDAEDLQGSRHWTTLALGDVLGIRTLYPTSAPMPPIYDP